MPDQTPIIGVRGLSKHFGSVRALHNLTIDVYSGEILAIIGDNGAGKSTFINILSGTIQPDYPDCIAFEGESTRLDNPKKAMGIGIQTVYQDLSLCNNLDATQNVFLGREITTATKLQTPLMNKIVRGIIDMIGSNIPNIDAPVGTRSGGQRQAIAIGRTALGTPKVILMDEPTAALGVMQRKLVSDYIVRLKNECRAVILVTQDLGEVVKNADRVAVFRIGKLVAILTGEEITRENMVAYVTGVNVKKSMEMQSDLRSL